MSLRRRNTEEQQEQWVTGASVAGAKARGHVFYERLNGLLDEAGFDCFIEELVKPYYARSGRPGIPSGVYFRMLFVGDFEGIDSQCGPGSIRSGPGGVKTVRRCCPSDRSTDIMSGLM